MKKVVIIAIIICLILIGTTKVMIDKKLKANIVETFTPVSVEPQTQEPTQTPQQTPQQIQPSNNRIVLGKSTYKEQPLSVYYLAKDGRKFDEYDWQAECIQISGLKDKQIESKINQFFFDNSINYNYGLSSFSNVFSYGIEEFSSESCFYNINLVDGRELTIDDYFYNKDDLKNVLGKYIVVAIDNRFVVGELERALANDYKDTDEEAIKIKEELQKYYSQIENWQFIIMHKYDKGDFEFFFDNNSLTLYFDNISFKNPIELFYPGSFTKELNKLFIKIPLYDMYPYVSIFDKFADAKNVFENDDEAQTRCVGLCDFELIKDNCIYASYDIEEAILNGERTIFRKVLF